MDPHPQLLPLPRVPQAGRRGVKGRCACRSGQGPACRGCLCLHQTTTPSARSVLVGSAGMQHGRLPGCLGTGPRPRRVSGEERSSTKQPLGPGVLCAEDRGGRERIVTLHLDRRALSPPKLICHFPLSTGGRGSRKTVHCGIKGPGCEGRCAPRPPGLSRGSRMSEQHGVALVGCVLLPEPELHLLKVTRWEDMPPGTDCAKPQVRELGGRARLAVQGFGI